MEKCRCPKCGIKLTSGSETCINDECKNYRVHWITMYLQLQRKVKRLQYMLDNQEE